MPITPNPVERLLFELNLAPALMLDLLGAQAFRVLTAGHRLGVFDALAGGPLTEVEAAGRIGADLRGTTLLLEALEALGYVKKRDGHYTVTAMIAKWLPILRGGIGFFEVMLDRFNDLEDSIRRGGPAIDARHWLDQRPGGWQEFQAGMIAFARIGADEVAAKIGLPRTARRLLDVGGGHGLYSIKLCRRYPQLSATVFDLPQALDAARETAAAEGMTDRIVLQAGDFWVDDLGSGYDAALLFNIIHGNLPEKNVELLRTVAGAVNAGGVVVILDQLTGKVFGAAARAVAALNGLNLFNLAGGQTYAVEEIAEWLRLVGFANPRRIHLRRSPGSGLVVATKTAAEARASTGRQQSTRPAAATGHRCLATGVG